MPTLLPIAALQAHGFSDRLIARWSRALGPGLLPLQARAIQSTGLLHGGDLIVFAPTSSGKTFVAEMAALRHLENRRRVIYLAPTKALAEEKRRHFAHTCDPLGFRTLLATRDHPEADGAVLDGDFDLLIAIYEKMKAYLVLRPELLGQVGLVVMDELQTLGEPGRGEVVDLILTKIARAPRHAQFIGLSAVLGDAQKIADWLRCELLVFRERPVELREGVLNCEDGVFTYRSCNSGEWGAEPLSAQGRPLPLDGGLPGRDVVITLALELVENRGEQTLVFVPTRQMTRTWAAAAAEHSGLPEATDALKALERAEDSHSRELLAACLRAGVAFHNADLAPELRRLVEDHFHRQTIALLFSTSTLAQGVNLTTRNVIQMPRMIATDPDGGGTSAVPLSLQRFRNQGGRAARFGQGVDFGRSILLARHGAEAERLRAEFLRDGFESLTPPLRGADLETLVTDLVASRACAKREELSAFVAATFSGALAWSHQAPPYAAQVDVALAEALEDQFLTCDERGRLAATGLGVVAATNGVLAPTATLLSQWVRQCADADFPDMEALALAAFTPDGQAIPVWLSERERRMVNYRQEILDRLGQRLDEVSPVLARRLNPPGGFTPEDHCAMKMAVAMYEWMGPTDTRDLEERFQMYAGSLAGLGAQFNWLLQTAASLARAFGMDTALVRRLQTLADRLTVGVEPAGLALARMRVETLGRGAIAALLRAGFETPQALAEADVDVLATVVSRDLAGRLVAEGRRRRDARPPSPFPTVVPSGRSRQAVSEAGAAPTAEGKTPEAPPPDPGAAAAEPIADLICDGQGAAAIADLICDAQGAAPRLVIALDGAGMIHFDGVRMDLSPLAHQLLLLLARSGGRGASYGDIVAALWPDAIVDRKQVTLHKSQVLAAMNAIAQAPPGRPWIETRRGFGLILHLPPETIALIREGAPPAP